MFLTNVCGGVSDRYSSVSTTTDVLLHVACYRFDPGGARTGWHTVDIFVSGEKEQRVVVLRKFIYGCKDILKVHMVV